MLERLNLIERSPDLNDKRRGFVSLTQHGADTMKNALSDMAGLLS
ncbi:hypothetical protein WSK_4215 [Novosphingobium sp. Rr 2-17]|nr:hypothetical protein WSK_4215 [Novosphingobium sp. Rr 2-17]